jgi:hypothetical protein
LRLREASDAYAKASAAACEARPAGDTTSIQHPACAKLRRAKPDNPIHLLIYIQNKLHFFSMVFMRNFFPGDFYITESNTIKNIENKNLPFGINP